MSDLDPPQNAVSTGISTVIIARRLKTSPEMLSNDDEMNTYLKLLDNRQKIWELADVMNPKEDYVVGLEEIEEITSNLKQINEILNGVKENLKKI